MNREIKRHLDEQAAIITSCMMELGQEIDPYSMSTTSPEYIQLVYDTVTDLHMGMTKYYIQTLAETIDGYSDDEDIVKQATDLIEDLKEYQAAFDKAIA